MSRRLTAVAIVATLSAAAPAVRAEDGWTTGWSNGFKVESKDGEFELKFGGRVQADYTFASGDPAFEPDLMDGFEFRRARLFFEGTIYERVIFKVQYDFAGGDASFKDVYIGLLAGPGELRFGHYKEYFSLEELTSSKYTAFAERSLPVEAFAPSRNSGIGYHDSKGDRLNWGVGVFYEADDFGVSENEDNINLTGRVAFRPIYEDGGRRLLHLGVAATAKELGNGERFRFRARPEAHFTTRFVDTGNFAADSALLAGVEVAGVFDRFWFAGEYIQNAVDAAAVGDPTFDGAYLQAGYFLTPDYRRFKTSDGTFDRQKPARNWDQAGGHGAWEVALRFSTLDLNDAGVQGGQQDNVTVGLNWYPNPATRWMLDWVRADVEGRGEADFIISRWQVDF